MTEQPTREQQLLHLVDRARRGVALPAEHDQLAAGVSAMAERLDRANGAIRHLLKQLSTGRITERAEQAEAERERAEDAIERVRQLCELTIAASVRAQAVQQALDTLAALDEPQPSTTTV